jgi:hypothetical protein
MVTTSPNTLLAQLLDDVPIPTLKHGLVFPLDTDQGVEAYAPLTANYDANQYSVYAATSDGRKFYPRQAGSSELAFEGLLSYQRYELYVESGSGTKQIGMFDTEFDSEAMFYVSQELFDFLNKAGKANSPRAQVLSSLLDNQTISLYEKASFIQHHFLKGNQVANLEAVVRGQIALPRNEKCDCSGVQTLPAVSLTPGGVINNSNSNVAFQTNYEQANGGPLPQSVYRYDLEKAEYFLESLGPAKNWAIHSDGFRETPNKWWGASVGGSVPLSTPSEQDTSQTRLNQYMYQSFNLYCNGGAFDTDCDCEKDLRVKWKYSSLISIDAGLISSGGTLRSAALADDVALGISIQEAPVITDMPTVRVAGSLRNFQTATCNQDPNDVFNNALGNLLASVAGLLFISTTTDGSSSTTVQGNIINQIITATGQIFSNSPTIVTNVNCGPVENVAAGFENTLNYALLPNRVLTISTAAGSRLVSRGMRSWRSTATVRSSFYMAAYQPSEVNSSQTIYECCFPRETAVYWIGAIPNTNLLNTIQTFWPINNNLPTTQTVLSEEIANWLGLVSANAFDFGINGNGNYTVNNDLGYLYANRVTNERCKLNEHPGNSFPDFGRNGDHTNSAPPNRIDVYTTEGRFIASIPVVDQQKSDVTLSEAALVTRTVSQQLTGKVPAGIYLAHYWTSQGPAEYQETLSSTVKCFLQ